MWLRKKSRQKRQKRPYLYKGLETVYDLGLIAFREQIVRYSEIRAHLRDSLLNLVMRDISGEFVDRLEIKNALQMLVTLGLESRSVYEEVFEEPLLTECAHFYEMESQKFLQEKNARLYIKRVEARINEETERVQHYLDKLTGDKVMEIMYQELIQKQLRIIMEKENWGLMTMLDNCKEDDLEVMYQVLGRVPGGVKSMSGCIFKHLREQDELLLVQEHDGTKALNYVEALINQADRFQKLHTLFEKEEVYQNLRHGFETLVNRNTSIPESLSLFIHDKLKKTVNKEADAILDKAVYLLRYFFDTYQFECYYKLHLAKRLLKNSVSAEREEEMFSKLKVECGSQFRTKAGVMLQNIKNSVAIMTEFKDHVTSTGSNSLGIDLSLRVLTTGFWPLRSEDATVILPHAPQKAYDLFKRFYLGKYNNRQLTLNPALGFAELNAVFYGEIGERQLTVEVSTYQMCVLLLFNSRSELTFDEILQQTNIPQKELVRVLQSLVGKSRILSMNPTTPEVEPADTFSVNDSFTSKLSKNPTKQETEQEG